MVSEKEVNILVISDLHFSKDEKYDEDPDAYARRKNCLDALILKLEKVEAEWNPNIVVVTGDVGYSGHHDDYIRANDWFSRLNKVLQLDFGHYIICPGNHDVDRKKNINMYYPPTKQKAKEGLEANQIDTLLPSFDQFINFKTEAKCPYNTLGESGFSLKDNCGRSTSSDRIDFFHNQLSGICDLLGLRFIILNSAWYSRDSVLDESRLWLGFPLLEIMMANKQISLNSFDLEPVSPIILTVLHHPSKYFSIEDDSFRFLEERSHFILTGHDHSIKPSLIQNYNNACVYNGGAVYDKSDYYNHCAILKINLNNRWFAMRNLSWSYKVHEWEIDNLEICCTKMIDRLKLSSVSSGYGNPESSFRQSSLLKWIM